MQTKKTITIDKVNHEVEVHQYENFQDLLQTETSSRILDLFNYRHAQIQCQEHKKRIKPPRKSIKERRFLAFKTFSARELKKFEGQPELFELELIKRLPKA